MKTKSIEYGFGTQIRKSPYFNSTIKRGAKAFSVYNHMYIPRDFGDQEKNFWNLINSAILCDVAVERQVEITGPDAEKFTQLLTGRNLNNLKIGQCKYVLITNEAGGLLNDPILLKLSKNHFWLSISDSDLLFWAQGVNVNSSLKVKIKEPDVSPLQLQGPNSLEIMKVLFGEKITNLKYYHFFETKLNNIPLVVSRTGWSSELGYEFFLRDGAKGNQLWDMIMKAGKNFNLHPGHTSAIRRIEAAMISYHADADINTNPYELGLGRLIDLKMKANFIGKKSLKKIAKNGPDRIQVGIIIEGPQLLQTNNEFWPIKCLNGNHIGKITSAIYSPRLKKNIALGLINVEHNKLNNKIIIHKTNEISEGKIVEKPFFDPQKIIPRI